MASTKPAFIAEPSVVGVSEGENHGRERFASFGLCVYQELATNLGLAEGEITVGELFQ